MKGRWIPFSADELRWIEERGALPRREVHAAFCVTFERSDVSLDAFKHMCVRKGWMTGRTGRIEKGSMPPNKGKRCPPGVGGNSAGARATQFKPGTRLGRAKHTYKPIGFECVRDGYLVRKINDDLPMQRRWRAVHLINWEARHGAVPKGRVLKCRDGDALNTDPTNWLLVSRGELGTLNCLKRHRGLDHQAAPAELKDTILAIARVKHAGRARTKAKVAA